MVALGATVIEPLSVVASRVEKLVIVLVGAAGVTVVVLAVSVEYMVDVEVGAVPTTRTVAFVILAEMHEHACDITLALSVATCEAKSVEDFFDVVEVGVDAVDEVDVLEVDVDVVLVTPRFCTSGVLFHCC